MARRYDSRTTTFSPEGRLYQVEYAMEAISHAGICVGILAEDGIVLAVEKKITSKLLENIARCGSPQKPLPCPSFPLSFLCIPPHAIIMAGFSIGPFWSLCWL
jgi:hypothetical protein